MSPPKLISEIFTRAETVLPPETRDYLLGAAGREATLALNRRAIERILFRPRVLRDVAQVDFATSLFDQPLRIPVFLAPVGSLGCFHSEGVKATARATSEFGTLLFYGVNAEIPIEEAARRSNRPLALQLYVYGERDWAATIIERAEKAGFCAICITVDTPLPARRERDIANDHQILASLPRPNLSQATLARGGTGNARVTWEDILFLKARTTLPIILKGIQVVDDAVIAKEIGAAAVYLSNHGGRQLDFSPATIDGIAGIRAAIGPDLRLLVDSGFRHGSDIVKAIALGADAVGVGRLHAAALAAAGEASVRAALEILELEIRETMAHLGVCSLKDLSPSYLQIATATGDV